MWVLTQWASYRANGYRSAAKQSKIKSNHCFNFIGVCLHQRFSHFILLLYSMLRKSSSGTYKYDAWLTTVRGITLNLCWYSQSSNRDLFPVLKLINFGTRKFWLVHQSAKSRYIWSTYTETDIRRKNREMDTVPLINSPRKNAQAYEVEGVREVLQNRKECVDLGKRCCYNFRVKFEPHLQSGKCRNSKGRISCVKIKLLNLYIFSKAHIRM